MTLYEYIQSAHPPGSVRDVLGCAKVMLDAPHFIVTAQVNKRQAIHFMPISCTLIPCELPS